MQDAKFAKLFAPAAVAALLALSASPAFAEAKVGEYLGKSETEISKTLTTQGYEVRKLDSEDGMIEAYATSEGKRFEIYVDPKTGNVVEVKQD